MPLSAYAVTCLMSGLSLAIWLWQIMQVFTLGMPAIGPFSTLSWQSVQSAFFAMCVLWGNGIGCSALDRMLKNSRAASDAVRRAGEYTAGDTCCVGSVRLHAPARSAQTTAAARPKPRATTAARLGPRAADAITWPGGSGG